MFIMNFKEIHSNTEFLSTYRRARSCSCQNKIKNTFIEKWLEHYVQATFGTFRLLLGGSTNVQLPLAKNEIYLAFSRSANVKKDLINKDFSYDYHLFAKNYSGTWWSYEQCLWIDALREVADEYKDKPVKDPDKLKLFYM